jgi:hypothetical protein
MPSDQRFESRHRRRTPRRALSPLDRSGKVGDWMTRRDKWRQESLWAYSSPKVLPRTPAISEDRGRASQRYRSQGTQGNRTHPIDDGTRARSLVPRPGHSREFPRRLCSIYPQRRDAHLRPGADGRAGRAGGRHAQAIRPRSRSMLFRTLRTPVGDQGGSVESCCGSGQPIAQTVPSSSMAACPPSRNPFITGFSWGSDWAINTAA